MSSKKSTFNKIIALREMDKIAPFGTIHNLLDGKFCSIDNIEQFLRRGVSINSEDRSNNNPFFGATPLHHAVQNENCSLEVIKYLLDNGANVRAGDEYGLTPLYYLVEKFREDAIDVACLLLDHGAEVEELDEMSFSPLHHAVGGSYRSNINIVKFLLDRGANFHAQCGNGRSVLHHAVKGDYDIIKVLLDRGADVHERDKENWQPMHFAVQTCNPRIINLLVKYGAKVNITDGCQLSPLYHSLSHFKRRMTKFLLDCGALVCCGKSPLNKAIGNYKRNKVEKNFMQVQLLLKYTLLENAVLNIDDNYSSSCLPEEFADYRTECFQEIHAMQQVSIDKTTLLQFIFQVRLELQQKEKVDIDCILNTLWQPICSNAFPLYNEVMIGLIKREYLEDFLGNQVLYAASKRLDPLSGCKKTAMVSSDVLLILARYLPKLDLLHLVFYIYDECRGDLKPISKTMPIRPKRSLSADEACEYSVH